MKKLLNYLLMVVLAVCFAVPATSVAEAATVALVPLINNVEGGDKLASQLYYKEAIATIKRQEGFSLVESAQVKNIIAEACIGQEVPDKETLARIAKKAGVDMVFAMQLDKLHDKPINISRDLILELNMEGVAVGYNALNDVYYQHEFSDDKQIDAALTSRWDWVHEEFARQVRVELKHAMKAKNN